MALLGHHIGFGSRQVVGETAEKVVEFVEQRFIDYSQKLPKVLAKANKRSWQTGGAAM